MPQKIKRIDSVFNPAHFKLLYYSNEPNWEEKINKKKKKRESNLYYEVVKGLEEDLTNLGIEITYASRIIIREIAQNILFLQRLKSSIICTGVLRNKSVLKPTCIVSKKDHAYSPKTTKSIYYEEQLIYDKEIDPLLDKLIPKLQKQINDGLKALGLLPSQLIEREKIIIVKKLRQKYENLCGEVSIEARKEVKNFG